MKKVRQYRGYDSAVERMRESGDELKEALKWVFSRFPNRVRRFSAEQIPTRKEAAKEAGRALGRFLSAAEDWIFEKCGLIGSDTILRFQRSYQREVTQKMEVGEAAEKEKKVGEIQFQKRSEHTQAQDIAREQDDISRKFYERFGRPRIVDLDAADEQYRQQMKEYVEKIQNRNNRKDRGVER